MFKKRNTVQRTLAEHIDLHMREIKAAFPAGTKMTLIIRAPTLSDPLVMTNDSAEEAIAAMRKLSVGKPGLIIQG